MNPRQAPRIFPPTQCPGKLGLPSHGRHLALVSALAGSSLVAPPASGNETYADLAPIFAQRCVMCHSGEAAPLGLRLDSFEAILKGSSKGPVVQAGDPAGSALIGRLKGSIQPRMPMTGPPFLPDREIARFEHWVAAGLPQGAAGIPPSRPTALRPLPGEPVTYLHVAPIFATRCAKCHTDNGLMGAPPENYRLTSHASTLSSADRVRVVPGKPEASELVRRIRGQALPRMPFDGPPYLTGEEIRLIEEWVAQGARNADGKAASVPSGATVRLHGRLGSGWRLDALDLGIDGRTRLDKAPRAGDYVEVRGYLDDAANVRVDRLRRR